MFAFIKRLISAKPNDPQAVDRSTVKLYIKVHKRFVRANNSNKMAYTAMDTRQLYDQLQLIRIQANRATNSAINLAFDLPEDYMLDQPLDRSIILRMST